MQLNIHIDDNHLQEEIARYISQRHIEANDFVKELIEHFFKKEETPLDYTTSNKKNAITLDFNLESEPNYRLFEEVNDVKKFSQELREDAWR